MQTTRPRALDFSPCAGRRPIVSLYSPKEYQEWQKEAADHLNAERFGEAAPLFTGPVYVELLVEVAKPKTTKLSAPKPDVDNYAKGVLDAITKDGRFWADDTQVVTLNVTKAWTTGTPGYHVTIRSL
jgi:Holliday junction resolvase RusA-like endonuclease